MTVSLNAMLGKTSVSMMVLLVAASFIGISSIHQYAEGQTPKPQKNVQLAGRVVAAIISASKTCTAFVELPGDKPNLLGLKPGTTITLIAPIESCVLFGLSKIGKTQIQFVTPAPTAPSSTLEYRVSQVILQ
jgi:amino acid transporter